MVLKTQLKRAENRIMCRKRQSSEMVIDRTKEEVKRFSKEMEHKSEDKCDMREDRQIEKNRKRSEI